MATRLDLILAPVERGEHEVTIDTEGYSREQVDRVKREAKAKGLRVSYDGRFVLVRPAVA